jgi:hypothetical protein
MLRILLLLVIAAHGLGHTLFLGSLLGFIQGSPYNRSWLLTAEAPARLVGVVLWSLAIIAFGTAAIGLLGQHGWWRGAAVIAAVISTAGLILFWAMPVTSPAVAALVVNLLVLGALVVVQWPSAEVVGA